MKKSKKAFNALVVLIGFLSVTNCIEPYEFTVKNNTPTLVVQGNISDKSFLETTQYPSDGRYFRIQLSLTDDVSDARGEQLSNAQIQLIDDLGNSWFYTEAEEDGEIIYELRDLNFKATAGRAYQLQISLGNQEQYESNWVRLPETNAEPIGDVSFVEKDVEAYVYISDEEQIRTIRGMNTTIELPKNTNSLPTYYKWTYDATWIYDTPLTPRPGAPSTCWAKNRNFLNSFDLAEDNYGGYKEKLFFMETVGNERIYDELSILITQQIMNKEYYFFWKELKERSSNSMLFDKLPYNLATNMKAVNNTHEVSGYFDVVQEQAARWYFNKNELSYAVDHDLAANCIQYQGPDGPAPECLNCLEYSHGQTVNNAPSWWRPE